MRPAHCPASTQQLHPELLGRLGVEGQHARIALFGQAHDEAVVHIDAARAIGVQRGPDGAGILRLERCRFQQVRQDAGARGGATLAVA